MSGSFVCACAYLCVLNVWIEVRCEGELVAREYRGIF